MGSEQSWAALREALKNDEALIARLEAASTDVDVRAIAAEVGIELPATELTGAEGPATDLSDAELESMAGGLPANKNTVHHCTKPPPLI